MRTFDVFQMKPHLKASIIILNYVHWRDTIECIDSLVKHINYPNYDIIVVDNFSPNDSFEQLSEYSKALPDIEVICIQNKENKGFANGNNLGAKYAIKRDTELFWFLNNDTIIKKDSLSPLIENYNGGVGILGSKLLFYGSEDTLQAIGAKFNPNTGKICQIGFNEMDRGQYDHYNQKLDFVVGASLFVSKQFIEEVGFMSEDYFLYFEELDWSLRAKQKGLSTKVCTDSVVYHKQGIATNNKVRGSKNKRAMYFQFKNLLLIYSKFFKTRYPIAIIVIFLRLTKFILKSRFKHLDLYFKVFLRPKIYSFD